MLFLQLNEWNQVGATYDNTTGVAQLWHNGKMVKSRNIGQIKLATQYPIRIGARDGDDRRFAGKISCLQIYDKALDEQQIGNLKSCPVKGNDCCFSSSKLVLQSCQSCATGYPLQVDSTVTLYVTFHYKRKLLVTQWQLIKLFQETCRQEKHDCYVQFSMFLISYFFWPCQ